jgi:hypothetical protein
VTRAVPLRLLAANAAVAVSLACAPPAPGLDQDAFVFFEARSRADDVLQRTPGCLGVQDSGGFPIALGSVAGVLSTVNVSADPSATVDVEPAEGDAISESWDADDFADHTIKRVTVPLGDGTIYTFTGMGRLELVCSF